MKYLKLIIPVFLLCSFSIISCLSVDKAQITADEFFEALNNENEEKMEALLDPISVIDAGIKDDFYNVFNQHKQGFGKVISHKRYGFHTSTNDGVTTVALKFKCETEKGSRLYESLKFVKRGNNYKIYEYQYNISQLEIDREDNTN